MVRVVVTAEAGIFKNGVHYAKGQGAYISLDAAQKFENVGEVKTLLGEGSSQPIAPTPPTLGNEAVNA